MTEPERMLRWLLRWLMLRPLVSLVLGLRLRGRERLPRQGPAIVVANHNSHLDTLVLLSLLPPGQTRPVAAADYFLRNRLLAWFALRVLGIIPLQRNPVACAGVGEGQGAQRPGSRARDPLADLDVALARGEVLILFPEGSRGEPERMQALKRGIAHLARRHPDLPIVPVFLHGLGKALPRGEALLVPFICDVAVGEAMHGRRHCGQGLDAFMNELAQRLEALRAEVAPPEWDQS